MQTSLQAFQLRHHTSCPFDWGPPNLDYSFTDASGNRWHRTSQGELRFIYNLANQRRYQEGGRIYKLWKWRDGPHGLRRRIGTRRIRRACPRLRSKANEKQTLKVGGTRARPHRGGNRFLAAPWLGSAAPGGATNRSTPRCRLPGELSAMPAHVTHDLCHSEPDHLVGHLTGPRRGVSPNRPRSQESTITGAFRIGRQNGPCRSVKRSIRP